MKPIRRRSCRVLLPVALCALGVALLSGCAGVQVKPPDLFLEKLGIEKVGITGLQMKVFFEMTNGNPHPLLLKFMEYDLEVNGHRIGKGYLNEKLSFNEMEKKKVVSTMNISWFSLPGTVKAIFDEKTVHAKVRGKYSVDAQGKERELKFDSEADIPVNKF